MADRVRWSELPAAVVRFVDQALGSAVVSTEEGHRGRGPYSADRVTTESGASAFVKAADRARFPEAFELLRREARALWGMPVGAPCARIIAMMNDGEWVAIVSQSLGGRHPDVDDSAAHRAVLDAILALPIEASPDLPALADEFAPLFQAWEEIAADVEVDGWRASDHLDELSRLTRHAAVALQGGDALVHADLRLEHAVILDTGEARLVDWPWACRGVSWFDALTYLLDVRTHGGSVAEDSFEHPVFAAAGSEAISAVLAGLAGYLFEASSWPAPPGDDGVRQFQLLQACAALAWLREREDLG